MSNDYSLYKTDQESTQAVSKVTYFNIIFGIPALALILYLLIVNKLEQYEIFSYIAIGVLVLGVGYSLFKLFKNKK